MSPVDRVDVEPDTFRAASQVFGDTVYPQLTTTTTGLEHALQNSGAMAGSDPAGTSWASTYDQAAREVHGVMADLASAAMTLAAMLQQTGFNHGRAESASDPTRTTPTPADTTRYDTDVSRNSPAIPSASGGSGSPPTGWGLIESAVGYVWPNGHQDKLRAAANAWSTAADGLEIASGDIPEAVSAIAAQQSAEMSDALTVCNGMVEHLDDVATACRALSKGCSDLADGIDKAHNDVKNELVSLLEWTAGIEAGGLLVGIFTAGIGEGAAQAAEAGRIAATASRVGKFIQTLVELAGTVARAVGTVFTKIGEIAQRLERLLGVRVTEATSEAAAKTPEIAKDAETAAEDSLAAADDTALHPDDPLPRHADGRPLSPSEAKSVRSLEQNVAEHEQKLADYQRDPYAYDNKGILKNAPNDTVRQQIIQGRIRHLETEINTFRDNITKIVDG